MLDPDYRFYERSSGRAVVQIMGVHGQHIHGPFTLTLHLWDRATGAVINNRNGQEVTVVDSTTNPPGAEHFGFTVAHGYLTWHMDPGDNAIVGSTAADEWEEHRAIFSWTYVSDGRTIINRKELRIDVKNLAKVEAA